MKEMISVLSLLLLIASGLRAEERLTWPRFRGPNGSGVAEGQKPPTEFGPDKNVKWKVPVPAGISSPIIAGEYLVLTAFDEGKLYTIAYRRTDGSEAWRVEAPAKELEAFHKLEGSPAASTPATDGKHIVSYFGSCGLFCYDLSGKELWRVEMPPASIGGDFGSGVSPIVEAGTVVLVRDEMKSPKILAFDVDTGSPRWEQKRTSMMSWCTPVIWETPDGKQVAAAGHVRMVGYDLGSGAERWSVGGLPSGCCSSPVIADGTLFFGGATSGGSDDGSSAMPKYDDLLKDLDKNKDGALSRDEAEKAFGGFFDNQDTNKDGTVSREEFETIVKFMAEGKNCVFALKAGGTGDITDSNTLWKRRKGIPYVASGILYENQYVIVRDGGIVIASDAKSGKQAYQERIAATGKYYASPVAAGGNIYFTALEGGAITVVKAGSPKSAVVAKNPELGERTAATPAIADDTLYVRTATQLYAFAKKK